MSREEISIKAIDCILYNRRLWRESVELLEAQTSASVVAIPLLRAPGDPVGSVAVARATITQVLDVVDKAIRSLPREHRRIAKLKWERSMTHNEIADAINYSLSTVERRVAIIRKSVKAHLAAMDEEILTEFWGEIEGILRGY